MSLLSRPVDVDEKEKEEFKDMAMLHVSFLIFESLWIACVNSVLGSHRDR
jgi:hypothetical protein